MLIQLARQQIQNQRAQIALEYILLVVVATTMVAVIISTLVSRDTSEPGILIEAWMQIIQGIAADNAGEIN
ncbi:MAG: hypothetical protein AB8E15_01845 [Bdellovibrionales bacterium]